MAENNELIQKQKHLLFPSIRTYYDEPLVVTSAQGSWIKTTDGKEYLDFFGGILTVSVGHSHPAVTRTIQSQAEKLVHASTLYINRPQLELAERLSKKAPFSPAKLFFTSSGTEADETAILTARLHTKAHDIIALRHGYHGRSALAMSLTGHAAFRLNPVPMPGIVHAVAPYCYRCPLGLSYPSCDIKCGKDVEELIQTTTNGRVAGMLVEPILGVGGFIVPPPDYFKVVSPIIKKYGGLIIDDEVQTGFGRTGDGYWGISGFGIEPDIMTGAKGTANGLAIGWTMARSQIADSFTGMTIATFGGNPLSTAAANATMQVIDDDKLQQNAIIMGERLRRGLEALQQKHSVIGEVRGKGLMQAVELVVDHKTKTPDAATTTRVMEETKKEGLLVGRGGLYSNTLRIAPALNISGDLIDEAVTRLDHAFQRATSVQNS